jgi:CHAT domain-containing protein/tetratricopeptide (TPR) repeat protein
VGDNQTMKKRAFDLGRQALSCVLLAFALNGVPLRAHGEFQASQSVEALNPGQSVNGKRIEGGRTLSFTLWLEAGQLADFDVEQHGSILLVSLYDRDEKEVISMDSPAGAHGPIDFSIIAPVSGPYRLDVKSTDDWALPATVDVSLAPLRTPAGSDQQEVAAHSLFAAGRTSFRNEKYADAIVAFKGTLKYWEATQNNHWRALTNFALSEAYRLSNSFKLQEQHLLEVLRIVEMGLAPNDWRLEASALNDLGANYGRSPQIDKGIELISRARTLYASHDDRRGQASAYNNLATMNNRTGNYAYARELIQKALELRIAENDKPGIGNLTNALAATFDRLGDPEQALNYSLQSLRIWEEIGERRPGDRRKVASVLSSIATLNDKLGRFDPALEYYDKALKKYDETNPQRATTLNNKGELLAALGKPDQARECYDNALQILEANEKPDLDEKAGILVHIGQLSLTAGDALTAIKWFEQARDLPPSQPRLADVLTNLGTALASNNQQEKALEVYQTTFEIQTKLKDRRGQALTLQKRGEAYVLQGKHQDALNDFKTALPLWQAVKDQRGEAATFNNIARVERSRGNLSEALAYNERAIRIVESLRTKISSHQLRTSYFAAQENYYELDVDIKMQLSKTENRDFYVAAALEANEKARARVLLEALNEAGVERSVTSETSDPRFSSMIEQRLKLLATMAAKAQVRTRYLNGRSTPEQIAVLDRDLRKLSDDYESLESEIRKRNPKFAKLTKPEPASLKLIQEQLDADTSLIEYSLGEPRSYAWVVTRESIYGFELAAGSEVEGYADRLKEALSARGRRELNETPEQRLERTLKAENDYPEAAALLSKAILTPIASKLTKKRLLIVADGPLQLLPFIALPDPNAVAVTTTSPLLMIDKHEMLSLPSASVLVLQRKELANRNPAPQLLAVIADPVFGANDKRAIDALRGRKPGNLGQTDLPAKDGETRETNSILESSRLSRALDNLGLNSTGEISRLRYAEREALAILKVAPPNRSFSAMGFKANRAALMNPKLAQFQIVHFATHGIMDLKNPELSGMLLSMVDEKGREQNGYIGLSEIYNLKLPADLVVLSACETGTGKQIKGEGIIALTRGFMYAGAERLVASLWRVNDQATAELMTYFYEEMLVRKLRPAAALREAQRRLSLQRKNPHYWAGFVIQGEWR